MPLVAQRLATTRPEKSESLRSHADRLACDLLEQGGGESEAPGALSALLLQCAGTAHEPLVQWLSEQSEVVPWRRPLMVS